LVQFDITQAKHNFNRVTELKMQRMQRQFGKLLPRTADDAQVGMLIKDFEEADQMLDTVGFFRISETFQC
jgi:hypothetical protein